MVQAVIVAPMPRQLTTSEVAAMATPPTTRFTVEREIRRGRLHAEKAGGRWMIDQDEALHWATTFIPYREQRSRHQSSGS